MNGWQLSEQALQGAAVPVHNELCTAGLRKDRAVTP